MVEVVDEEGNVLGVFDASDSEGEDEARRRKYAQII